MNVNDARNDRQRVVITGLGAVSPLGLDVGSTWQGLSEGNSGVSAITTFDTRDFPTKIAASVQGFDPTLYLNQREARRMSPFILYALAAALVAKTPAWCCGDGMGSNRSSSGESGSDSEAKSQR